MKKSILLLSQRPSDFVEIQRVAAGLERYPFNLYVLYVSNNYYEHYDVLSSLAVFKSQNKIADFFCFSCSDGRVVRFLSKNNRKESKKKKSNANGKLEDGSIGLVRSLYYSFLRMKKKGKNILIFEPLYFISTNLIIIESYIKSFKFYRKIIKDNKINLIIMPEDVVGMVTPLLIKAGHKSNVPSIIIPYTIANQDEAFQSLKNNPDYSLNKKYNFLIGYIFRKWVMRRGGTSLLRLPACYVLMHFLTRTSPPQPWLLHSGYADMICVENQKMYEYYIKAGLPKKQLSIVGAFYDDFLFLSLMKKEARKKQLIKEVGLSASKPILLVGGCPNQLCNCPQGVEFKDMVGLVEFLVSALKPLLNDFSIIVRPHPNFTEFGALFQKHEGFVVSSLDTASLIALSDAYIAFASATIRWAISSGLPTINYDVFQYDYDDYKYVPGILNVRYKKDFLQAISFIIDKDKYVLLKQELASEKGKWGMLDGHSGERIVKLIDSLIKCTEYKEDKKLSYDVT